MPRKIMCARCGRVHAYGGCEVPTKKNPGRNALFRSSYAWTEKSKQIRERDNYICQACLHSLGGGGGEGKGVIDFTGKELEVHHIEKLEKDFEKRLDDYNLITLCKYHHELAERGEIKAGALREIAARNSQGVAVAGE